MDKPASGYFAPMHSNTGIIYSGRWEALWFVRPVEEKQHEKPATQMLTNIKDR